MKQVDGRKVGLLEHAASRRVPRRLVRIAQPTALALVLVTALATKAFAFSGVQTNVPIASLTGWTLCYTDSYGHTGPLANVLTACNQAHLLLACRPNGSSTLTVAAHAPRADVLFDTGTGNVPHNANGVGWYFNNSWSWGFALQGDEIQRNSCDVEASPFSPGANPDKRLCWHTSGNSITDGWRCGADVSLFSNTHERLVFHANSLSCGNGVLDPFEPCDDGNTDSGDGCDSGCGVEPCYSCSGEPSTCAPLGDGSACDDGLFCNGTDTCLAASCAVHAGDPCPGGAECQDTCDEGTDTCNTPFGTACTDDGNVCTDDQCDGLGACEHFNTFFTPCDDGVFCNGSDQCLGGTCQFHDGDPCLLTACTQICNEASDLCEANAPGTPCADDLNACTGDECDGAGTCIHPAGPAGVPCTDDNNICTNDVCDGGGTCGHPPVPNGSPCESDANQCTNDWCNGAGNCTHLVSPDGSACNDSNACTQTDACQAGVCTGSDPVVCTSSTPCYDPGTCDPTSGVCTNCPAGFSQGAGGCQATYEIDATLLDNLNTSCDGTGMNRYNGCSSIPFGFHWTDTADDAVGAVTRVDVDFNSGIDCGSNPHTVSLNGTNIGVYATTAFVCVCLPDVEAREFDDVDASTYVKGGLNAVSISTNNCAGLSQGEDGNYGVVTVTYDVQAQPLLVRSDCRPAAKSGFRYRDNDSNAKDRMLWKWRKGEMTTPEEFSDPRTSSNYEVCVFHEEGNTPTLLLGARVPPSASAWGGAGGKGFKYSDAAGTHGGITGILLRGGEAGKSKVIVKGRGDALGDPSLPLSTATTGIRAQLTNMSNGVCWESEFPLSTITADEHDIRASVP